MDKKYLPSKKFLLKLTIIAVAAALIFGVYELVRYWRHRGPSPEHPMALAIKDVVQKDSNNNGIPDWEEYMWGLDPNTNGDSNKEYILAQRKILADQEGLPSSSAADNAPISDNDALSRQYFAVIMSLEQTGNLNDESLKSVSDAIGKQVVADPIADVYTKGMLNITDSSTTSIRAYYVALGKLFIKYKDKNIGDELSFIATALKDNDAQALKFANEIGLSYQAFGKELIAIPVPSTLIAIDLDLANNYDKTGQTVEGMAQLFSDPITAMKALINYNKYDNVMVADIDKMTNNAK